jgi:hypothetical protein
MRASVLLLEFHLLFCEQCQAVPSKPLSTSSIPTLVYYLSFHFEAILFLGFQFQSFFSLQYYFAMLLWLSALLGDHFHVLTTPTMLPQRNTS